MANQLTAVISSARELLTTNSIYPNYKLYTETVNPAFVDKSLNPHKQAKRNSMPHEDQDQELDPKKLKFGMTKSQIEEVKRMEKARRKKIAKNWRPTAH